MKKIFILSIFLLVVLIISGCSRQSGNNDNLADKPSEPRRSVYKNLQYGFELQHPSNWNVYDQEKDKINLSGITISPLGAKQLMSGNQLVLLNIVTTDMSKRNLGKNKALKDYSNFWINQMKQYNKDSVITVDEEKNILADGMEFVKIEYKNKKLTSLSGNEDVLGDGSTIWFDRDNIRYTIDYSFPKNQGEKYEKDFEDIIKSIKFQKQ